MLFHKRVVHTKLDIYVFIVYIVKTQILQSNFIGKKIPWHKRCKKKQQSETAKILVNRYI